MLDQIMRAPTFDYMERGISAANLRHEVISDNLANAKFNGDHGEPAMVTGFVRKNPNGILIFDEIEKAINRYGGVISVFDTIDLQLARKP